MTVTPRTKPPASAPETTNTPMSMAPAISDIEFSRLRALVLQVTGISLSDQKKALVVGRLGPRLRHRKIASFGDYHHLLQSPSESDELQIAIDLITTNETSFFREAEHFEVLKDYIQQLRPIPFPFRVWSAASSSGEEAYTIAMVLSDSLGSAEWNVMGTDISTRVLERARKALYPMERAAAIPRKYLERYCLKGQGKHEGLFLVDRPLRERVSFVQANLCKPLPKLGPFQVAFLRNILIYFDLPQKKRVVEEVMAQIKPGGLLIVGHSESITGLCEGLTQVRPTIYRVS